MPQHLTVILLIHYNDKRKPLLEPDNMLGIGKATGDSTVGTCKIYIYAYKEICLYIHYLLSLMVHYNGINVVTMESLW